jgi:hypothetical protein
MPEPGAVVVDGAGDRVDLCVFNDLGKKIMGISIVGLGGKAGSGKNTAAAYLADLGYQTMAFADPLKEAAGAIFGFGAEQLDGDLKEIVDRRLQKSPRFVLQALGDACRGLWPEVFVAALRRRLRPVDLPVVVTDVRFGNEAQSLAYLGAILIRIDRPGAQAVNGIEGHHSETALDGWQGWHATVMNDGDRYSLYKKIGYVLKQYHLFPFGER